MSLGPGVKDVIAIIRVAMELYENIICVARDAKKEFGLFSRELKNLKSTLEGIKKECRPEGKLTIQSSSEDQQIILDLKEAVEITKESLKCWNALLEDFARRSQTIPWRLAWARKYPKITQCRDRIHIQSKLLEIAMLRVQTSQNSIIISEIQVLKSAMPPMPSLSDPENPIPDLDNQPDVESTGFSITYTESVPGDECSMSNVASIIQVVDEKIRRIKVHNKPIHCKQQIPENTPTEEFTKRFQESADIEAEDYTVESWLRLGTWWLLKSTILHELGSHLAQCYIDLLKSSWILYNALGMSNVQSPETQAMIKSLTLQDMTLLKNLASAISNHTNSFKESPILSDTSLAAANFNILEPVAAEEFDTSNIFEPSLDPRRWITIEKEHAGEDDEKVLYRTFVQAQIGSRSMRLLVEDTDYMLCLVVPSEEIEPMIILSNQAGTMNLSCTCSSFPWTHETQENDTTCRILTIPFSQRPVPLIFKSHTDYTEFTSLAQKYLKTVGDRKPTEGENQIFRSVLQGYIQKNVISGRPIQPPYPPSSESCYWELRIHETMSEKYWQTVRRLVISSCARAKSPKCKSFFLPPSSVYVGKDTEDPSNITLRWSDCSKKDTDSRMGGNFNKLHTYGYFPDNPNHCIKFSFLNGRDAMDFSNVVLCLNTSPMSKILLQSWTSNYPEYRLFRVRDFRRSADDPEHYKALVVTKLVNSGTERFSQDKELWRRSDIYFFGRDMDYIHVVNGDGDHSFVDLIGVYHPLYLSNYIDQPRDATTSVEFSHAKVRKQDIAISLEELPCRTSHLLRDSGDIVDLPRTHEFISALSDTWNMILSMKVLSVEFARPALFVRKTKKIEASLQVWSNGTSERLVARRIVTCSEDSSEWISVQGATEKTFREAASHEPYSSRMTIRQCTVWRGNMLNMVTMQAINGRTFEVPEFSIQFKDNRQRDEFGGAFQTTSTNIRRTASSATNLGRTASSKTSN